MIDNINFLPRAIIPGGQVVVAPGATETILELPTVLSSAADKAIFLKSIDAVNTGVGAAAGNFTVVGDAGASDGLIILAVGVVAVGTRVSWEFPVPIKFITTVNVTLPATIGTWAFIANGFYLG